MTHPNGETPICVLRTLGYCNGGRLRIRLWSERCACIQALYDAVHDNNANDIMEWATKIKRSEEKAEQGHLHIAENLQSDMGREWLKTSSRFRQEFFAQNLADYLERLREVDLDELDPDDDDDLVDGY